MTEQEKTLWREVYLLAIGDVGAKDAASHADKAVLHFRESKRSLDEDQRQLWVVGRNDGDNWHILGVFDQEPLAVLAATDEKDFVGPIKLNLRLIDNAISWPNAYYPEVELGDDHEA